ncbi:hypothetical protein SK128_024755, partial [Halocaridina rubra]
LANVLLQDVNFSNKTNEGHIAESEGKVPGALQFMNSDQIQILLDALQLSYMASVEFDRRPGLKFLIQKVAQSERAANLYKQAGASWTLRMVTLFDLTLSQVKNGLGLEEVKTVLEKDTRTKNTIKEEHLVENAKDNRTEAEIESCHKEQNVVKPVRPAKLLKDDTMQYIHLLRDSFTELCNVYLDLVIDKDGHYSAVDKMNDQPIFFLTIQPDEFPTAHRKSLEKWTKNLVEFNDRFTKGKQRDLELDSEDRGSDTLSASYDICDNTARPNRNEEGRSDSCHKKENLFEETLPKMKEDLPESRPFTLADLAQEYSSDSEDSEIIEYADVGDSGVASLAGGQQSVYRVVTEREVANLITDYRRRKNQHSLPSTQHEKRVNPFLDKKTPRTIEPVPPEIEEQRTTSLMK